MCVFVLVYSMCVQVLSEARRGHQIPPELALWALVSHPMWVKGAELRFSKRVSFLH